MVCEITRGIGINRNPVLKQAIYIYSGMICLFWSATHKCQTLFIASLFQHLSGDSWMYPYQRNYPSGKSLYKHYIVGIYGLESPRIPRLNTIVLSVSAS